MNKHILVEQIVARLDAELLRYAQAARDAQAGAVDEQSRAENKYDTRGLEASYLAHGQSRQALETTLACEQLASLPARDFGKGEPIAAGALVELECDGEHTWYFLAPAAGGTEIVCEGREVLVITPQSPLGRAMSGIREGERIELGAGNVGHVHTIAKVL